MGQLSVEFSASLQSKVLARALEMANASGIDAAQRRFAKLPSFIPVADSRSLSPAQVLIDIGGTSTKVGLRIPQANALVPYEYCVLFEDANQEFQTSGIGGSSLRLFADAVVGMVDEQISHLQIARQPEWAVGIVWSNAMINKMQPDGSISGVITNRARYTKDEWFNQDTQDGDDVSKPFLDAFEAAKMNVVLSLVANDTPLTMKALPHAHAGMVASTGINGTLVDTISGVPVICNAEMGTGFDLSPEFLLEGDTIFPGITGRVIEHQISGKFLPQIFCGHLLAHRESSCSNLGDLVSQLKDMGPEGFLYFQTEDLTNLIYSPGKFVARHSSWHTFSGSVLTALQRLAQSLVIRSAKLTAILAGASVCNQVETGKQLVVALDSRLAREIPLFWDTAKSTLGSLGLAGSSISFTLIDRKEVEGGVFSVPMLGASNALDSLVSSCACYSDSKKSLPIKLARTLS